MNNTDNTRIIRRLYKALFPVQALSVGLPGINSLLNSIIAGNYLGEEALAAIGFAGPVLLLTSAISCLISYGSRLICGRYLGRGDQKGINSSFNTMLLLCLISGTLLSGVLLLFPGSMATLMGAEGSVHTVLVAYLKGLGIGIFFSILSTGLMVLSQLERMGSLTTVAALAMLVINVGGSFLSVLYFDMGIYGIGLFQSLSYIASVLVVGIGLMLKTKLFRISPKDISAKTAVDIIVYGSTEALGAACYMVRSCVVNRFVFLLGGTLGMAAMAVAGNITVAVGCVIEAGYRGSAATISSILVGHRDCKSLRELPGVIFRSSWFISLGCFLLVFIFAKPIALLLGADPAGISTYVSVIRNYNLWFLTTLFASSPISIYLAMGEVKLVNKLTLLFSGVLPISFILLFAKELGLGSVIGLTWGTELCSLLLFAIYYTYKARRLPSSILTLCYIPDSLSAPKENRLETTVSSIEDAVEVSQQAISFCLEKGFSKRLAYHCGLCIEEISADAVQNRFTKNSSTMDIRIIYEDGAMHILMRDDSPAFNPVEWLKLCSPEDELRSIGIRTVSAIAEEMNYVSTLGMNVLRLRISKE